MPTVRLTAEQCRDNDLPNLCAVCGEAAAERIERPFTWFPRWITLASVLMVFLMPVYIRRMTVRVPVCGRHRTHWSRPPRIAAVGFALTGLPVLAVIGPPAFGGRPPLLDVPLQYVVIPFLGTLIGLGYWHTRLVQPAWITPAFIDLKNVSEAFAAAAEVNEPPRRAYDEYDDG